jgi:serine palmitoyltransferase
MLFPAVYELGFRVGQSVSGLWYHGDTSALPSGMQVFQLVKEFPGLYKDWWIQLVVKDPLHVLVETTLLISIIYMVVSRTTEGYTEGKDKLTTHEEDELLQEWKHKTRAPLAPSTTEDTFHTHANATASPMSSIIVHQQDGKWLTVSSSNTETTTKVLNFCNFDFLGMQTSQVVKDASTLALKKYGCGSCGPRGFYGTIDAHLQLEDAISKFTKTDNAILYSDGASTCSSTVAAFAKRGDVLVVDEGVYEPIMTGVFLSRANIHYFKHNDMEDLEKVLHQLQLTDKKLGRKPNAQRRFIVVEGLYKNLGTIAPLDKIVQLKHKYHYRLILDESFSFGTLGKTGRGALEEYDQKYMYDAEIVTIALENALGSIGGVTVGNEEVVDHQRLSGAGYCFSAAAPPFTASAAVASLEYMQSTPACIQTLQSNVKYMYQQLYQKLTSSTSQELVVTSDTRSPIVVLQLPKESVFEADITSGIMQECLQRGIAVVATGQDASSHLRTELAPAIRMTVSTLHTKDDMDKAIDALVESANIVTARYPLEEQE